jgi:alanine dehydrogenase
MDPIYLTYLNRRDIEALKLSDQEVLDAIESGLARQGRGEAVIEPRVHLEPKLADGHFNVLRGALGTANNAAGVKIVGDFVDNYKPGRESEDETILLWHRGLSLSDIALGHAMLKKGELLGIGQRLRYA